MEFENQCNRIYNQLDFEKQRDTESEQNLTLYIYFYRNSTVPLN